MKFENMTVEELIEMDRQLCTDPNNRNPNKNSVYKYNKETQKKLDKIGKAIFHLTTAQRKERGEYVNEAGYSGRQTKRGVG